MPTAIDQAADIEHSNGLMKQDQVGPNDMIMLSSEEPT